jgi:HK97 gp10 family phage protein
MAKVVAVDSQELKLAVLKIRALSEFATARERQGFLRRGARILRDAARENVPIAPAPYTTRDGNIVRQGFTPEAVEVKKLRKSNDLWVGVVRRDGILPYWAFWLEFGAYGTEGFGFMRRALESKKGEVIAAIVQDAGKTLKKIVARISK